MRYPLCEVHDKVEGEHDRVHGPMSRTAARKLFRRLAREYRERRPLVPYLVSCKTITPTPTAPARTGEEDR